MKAEDGKSLVQQVGNNPPSLKSAPIGGVGGLPVPPSGALAED